MTRHTPGNSLAILFLILMSGFVLHCAAPRVALAIDWLQTGKELLGGTTQPAGQPALPAGLSNTDVIAGLKDALRVGSENVVGRLGQADGFNTDPAVHIPLPEQLESVRSTLKTIGMAGMLDDLELKLNRAAELATPKAKALFWESIDTMTLDDAQAIYNGPNDAATRYFEGKMSQPLAAEMQPVIDQSLNEVGAIQAYDAVMGQYQSIPFVPNVKADLTSYVTEKGMDGIFHYLAIEEAAIRENPVKRTTDILQKVFGAQ